MKKIYEDIKKALDSKIFIGILYGIGIVIGIALIFTAGITVGFHKASFARAWGENYNENFGMGHKEDANMNSIGKTGMMDYFPDAHGAVGKIIRLELPNIIVQDKDNTEKAVLINTDTKIQNGRDTVATTDLKLDDFVVVIGTPDDKGVIEAKFIRVIPSPEFLNK